MSYDSWKSDQPDPYVDDMPCAEAPVSLVIPAWCRTCKGTGVIWDGEAVTGRLRFPVEKCQACEGTGETLESPEREG